MSPVCLIQCNVALGTTTLPSESVTFTNKILPSSFSLTGFRAKSAGQSVFGGGGTGIGFGSETIACTVGLASLRNGVNLLDVLFECSNKKNF